MQDDDWGVFWPAEKSGCDKVAFWHRTTVFEPRDHFAAAGSQIKGRCREQHGYAHHNLAEEGGAKAKARQRQEHQEWRLI